MSKIVFGVDIGGTTVKLGVFKVDGTLMDKWEIPTRTADGGKYIFTDIADSILKKIAALGYTKEDCAGVGVGAPGPVDSNGIIYGAINLGWGDVNLYEKFTELLGMPVKAGNDANVAALGEMWQGGGQGYTDIVAVTLGTGIGGGVIIGGKLVTGSNGAGGEIGHIPVEENETETCGCGKTGCAEQYGSATGVVRLAKRRLALDNKPSTLRKADRLSAKMVWDAVKAGDEVAIDVAKQFGYYVGKMTAAIACVTNPQAFVVGGGVSKAGEVLFEYIRPEFERMVFKPCKNVDFKLATLGNDAGIYGAAKLVLGE